ncbi:MAG: DUF805 domain-containing protein [Candidatus Riflebacteria bacterium]|nr:DUF805 domain-containing protein [Candidatus Riflebacteria bacterium]
MNLNFDFNFNEVKGFFGDFNQIKSNFVEVAKNCFDFKSNLNRTKYFSYTLPFCVLSFLVNGICMAILGSQSMVGYIITGILGLVIGIITLGPAVCRLRDTGNSLWLLLCAFPGIFCCGIPTLFLMYIMFFVGSHNGGEPAVAQPAAQPQDQPPAGN